MAISLSNAARSAMCNALVDLADLGAGAAGHIEIRSGSRPANPDTTAAGTVLADVVLEDPAFGAAANGVATLSDPAAVTGEAAGTATWFRLYDTDDTAVFDGDVTATGGGGDLTLSTTTISVGLTVDITGGSITVPVGGS